MAEMEPKKSNIVALPFYLRTGATGSSSTALVIDVSTGHSFTRRVVPFDGSVVGLNAWGQNPVGTGSITFRVFDAGTAAVGITAVTLDTTNTGSFETTLRRGQYAVSAGDVLGVQYTSGATLAAGASSAFCATVWMHIEQN
jgi:hypothetical protein